MNKEEISVYFAELLKYCYSLEHKVKYKLWAKKDKTGKIVTDATPLDIYDAKAENILPRSEFVGRGSGGSNISYKLKMVSAYLLHKMEKDHNTYCDTIPHEYDPVEVDFDNVSARNLFLD